MDAFRAAPDGWMERVGDGVARVRRKIERPCWNDDGSLAAWWVPRAEGVPLRARERVYVVELATGREVCALDGPEVVRALAWLDRETLLVQREYEGGAWVTAHAIPDGGAVAEALLADTGQWPGELQVACDRSAVLFAPRWGLGVRGDVLGYALRGDDLSVLRVLRPLAIPRGNTATTPGPARLSPDGRRVVLSYWPDWNTRAHGLVWTPTDLEESPRTGVWARSTGYFAPARWLGAGRLLACDPSSSWFCVVPEPPEGEERTEAFAPLALPPRRTGSAPRVWDYDPVRAYFATVPASEVPEAVSVVALGEVPAPTEARRCAAAALSWSADGDTLWAFSSTARDLSLWTLGALHGPAHPRWQGPPESPRTRPELGWSLARTDSALLASGDRHDGAAALLRFEAAWLREIA